MCKVEERKREWRYCGREETGLVSLEVERKFWREGQAEVLEKCT
jgi:hypothetical protein